MKSKDDEIQILGTKKPLRSKGHRKLWIIALVAACTMLAVLGVYLAISNKQPEEVVKQLAETPQEKPTIPGSLQTSVDSINNVPFRVFALHNVNARLETTLPAQEDTTVLLAVPAADYRKDNNQMVGDFVVRGKQLSRGQRKTGYLAIVDNKIVLGNTDDDQMRDYCIKHQGDFFRQYILVYDGEMQENHLKGKAFRRALAKRGNDWYVIESLNRESLYDFSEAMADYGFTAALYLVGQPSHMVWHDAGEWHSSPTESSHKYNHPNYLVFRR